MTMIKCCGLRRSEDVAMINAAGADFAGFIMSSGFWRYVEPERVAELKKLLKPGIMAVGVFVNEPVEYVAKQLTDGTIDIAQLHGTEDDDYIAELRKLTAIGIKNDSRKAVNEYGEAFSIESHRKLEERLDKDCVNEDLSQNRSKRVEKGDIIKAFKIKSAEDIERAVSSSADYILLDSGTGTGQTFDWTLMSDIKRPYFFAGGLTPENAAGAVKRFHPYAVDVSSGIETDKKKDMAKIAEFAVNVRAAELMPNEDENL